MQRSFFTSETRELRLQRVLLWSKLICVTCKLLMSVYLNIKSLYPHLKVNWNVLMCKICITRRLVVDIFPWCNTNFVPFPSGTLVAGRMRNGSVACVHACSKFIYVHVYTTHRVQVAHEFWDYASVFRWLLEILCGLHCFNEDKQITVSENNIRERWSQDVDH